MQTIPVANLALVLIPAALVVGILWRWSASAGTSILCARTHDYSAVFNWLCPYLYFSNR